MTPDEWNSMFADYDSGADAALDLFVAIVQQARKDAECERLAPYYRDSARQLLAALQDEFGHMAKGRVRQW